MKGAVTVDGLRWNGKWESYENRRMQVQHQTLDVLGKATATTYQKEECTPWAESNSNKKE